MIFKFTCIFLLFIPSLLFSQDPEGELPLVNPDKKVFGTKDAEPKEEVPIDTVVLGGKVYVGTNESLMKIVMEKTLAAGFRRLNEIFAKFKQKELGIHLYQEFLKDNSNNRIARLGCAQLLGWSGEYSKAIKEYRAVLAETPKDITALMGLALTTAWSKDYAKAKEVFNEIINLNPEIEDAHVNLARVLSWERRYDDAISRLEQVLLKNPRSLYGHEALAYIMKWTNNNNKAIEHFQTITELQGDKSVIKNAHFQLVELYWINGEMQRSLTKLKVLFKQDPHNKIIENKLQSYTDYLRHQITVSLSRYQEIDYKASPKSNLGIQQLNLSYKKNLSHQFGFSAHTNPANESAGQTSLFRGRTYYELGVVHNHFKVRYNHREKVLFNVVYSPSIFWDLGNTIALLGRRTSYHGAHVHGYVVLGTTPLYMEYGRSPHISNKNNVLLVQHKDEYTVSLPIKLSGNVIFTPKLGYSFMEDTNRFERYELRVEKNDLMSNGTGFLLIDSRRYSFMSPHYFNYHLWNIFEAGLRWENLLTFFNNRQGAISVPALLKTSIDFISLQDRKITSFGMSLEGKPQYIHSNGSTTQLVVSMHLNSQSYFVYFIGVTYVLSL